MSNCVVQRNKRKGSVQRGCFGWFGISVSVCGVFWWSRGAEKRAGDASDSDGVVCSGRHGKGGREDG